MTIDSRILESWSFLLNASGNDLKDIRDSLKKSVNGKVDEDMSADGLVRFFSTYLSNEPLRYHSFLMALHDSLKIKSARTGNSIEDLEDDIMEHYVKDMILRCNGQQLARVRKVLGLTNSGKPSMIEEVSVKMISSSDFRRMVPSCLSAISLGRIPTSIAYASMGSLGTAIGAVTAVAAAAAASAATALFPALSILGFLGAHVLESRAKKASAIIPSVFVLINLRRDLETAIGSAKDAIKYMDAILKNSHAYPSISETAYKARLELECASKGKTLRFISEYDKYDKTILRDSDIKRLAPFRNEVMDFLSSYANRNDPAKTPHPRQDAIGVKDKDNDGADLTGKAVRRTGPISRLQEENRALREHVAFMKEVLHGIGQDANRVKDKEDDGADLTGKAVGRTGPVSRLQEENRALREQVAFMNEVLHGIRHNLSTDFAGVLGPYYQYVNFSDQPFPVGKVESALRKGEVIVEALRNAGLCEFGKPEKVDLVQALHEVFDGAGFTITEDSEMPQKADILFNRNDLHVKVLNNIRTNIEKHAFGRWDDALMPTSKRLVRLTLTEDSNGWTLDVENNGEPFPAGIDPESVFEFGTSYDGGNDGGGLHGSGMFYLSRTVLHFGGQRAFIPQEGSAFTVRHQITFKKA